MNNPVHHVWYGHKRQFQNPSFTLRGHSVSARCSAFWVSEFRTLFDAGIMCPFAPEYVFITHGHADHAALLPTILSGQPRSTNVYVPKGTRKLFEDLLMAKTRLSSDDPNIQYDHEKARHHLIEVEPGDTRTIQANGRTLRMRAFKTFHSIRSIGYALFEQRQRLQTRYRGCKGAEIAALRKQGVSVMEQYDAPLIVYTGDSTPQWFTENDLFQRYTFPYIICECTFIGALDEDGHCAAESAKKYQHTHWEALEPIVTANRDTTFILVHWSDRYAIDAIETFFADVPNVVAWTW